MMIEKKQDEVRKVYILSTTPFQIRSLLRSSNGEYHNQLSSMLKAKRIDMDNPGFGVGPCKEGGENNNTCKLFRLV